MTNYDADQEDPNKYRHIENPNDLELEFYGDSKIASFEGRKIPKFLIFTYVLLPIWGIIQFYYFWNGSTGWFDRGYWHELQIAANTTFPIKNHSVEPDDAMNNED